MIKVKIIIPCINLWSKYTKPCIDSIKSKYDWSILIIDNASSDETKIESAKIISDKIQYKRNDEIWSCAKSWNYGINEAFKEGNDYVMVINNDVLLHPEAIDTLIERFEKEKEFSPSASSDLIDSPLVMISCMNIRGELLDSSQIFTYDKNSKKDCRESEHPDFSAFMINKKCWDKVGEFDEEFSPCYFEDNSYHYRIKLNKMLAICLPTSVFYHFGSKTQFEALKAPICNSFQFERNRKTYIDMWGGIPGEEKFKTKYGK